MSAAWIGVASGDHVAKGRAGGFMQVCHGKRGPLARIRPGDRIFYYSPSTEMGGGERLQSFTAAGNVRAGEPYLFDMGGASRPFGATSTGGRRRPRRSRRCSTGWT